jgi:hypothetical protein
VSDERRDISVQLLAAPPGFPGTVADRLMIWSKVATDDNALVSYYLLPRAPPGGFSDIAVDRIWSKL